MTTEPMVFLGDRLVPQSQALVPVTDRGFLSGDGVFEALKVVAGHPFALTRHLRRLDNSLAIVGIALPTDLDLSAAVFATIAANANLAGPQGRLRITITAGTGTGIRRTPDAATVVITMERQFQHSATAKVITCPAPNNERAATNGAKTTSYAENVVILERARAVGADEALLPDTRGRLSEGTTCNVLVSYGGHLVTPTLATGCLPGVTRDLILEWGIARERDVPFAYLAEADEVLLSSSTRDLIPVASLDGRRLTAPGPLATQALAVFAQRAGETTDP